MLLKIRLHCYIGVYPDFNPQAPPPSIRRFTMSLNMLERILQMRPLQLILRKTLQRILLLRISLTKLLQLVLEKMLQRTLMTTISLMRPPQVVTRKVLQRVLMTRILRTKTKPLQGMLILLSLMRSQLEQRQIWQQMKRVYRSTRYISRIVFSGTL